MIQKVLFLFRASPYASACGVADIPESGLSDIRHHPPPRLPDGRLKRNKIKKPPLAVKKARLFAGTKNEYIICAISFQGAYINIGSDICTPPSLS